MIDLKEILVDFLDKVSTSDLDDLKVAKQMGFDIGNWVDDQMSWYDIENKKYEEAK